MSNLKGNRTLTSANTPMNALSFLIENIIKGLVATAIPVRVDAVQASGTGSVTGKLTCTPLVTQYDAKGNALAPTQSFEVPYLRYQGGIAAVVCDPVVGDIGIAIFAHQDISNVKDTTPVQPASFRAYDQADALYIGGILNQAPQIWLELTQDGIATLHAPTKVIIEAPEIELLGTNSIALNSPNILLDSPQTTITGNLNTTGAKGSSTSMTGTLDVTGDVTAGNIRLQSHTHGGVQTGSGSTGAPQ